MILRNGIDTTNVICDLYSCENRYYDFCLSCNNKLCSHCIQNSIEKINILTCPFCRSLHIYDLNFLKEIIELNKRIK